MMARFGWTQSTDCNSTDSSGSSRQSSPRSRRTPENAEWGVRVGESTRSLSTRYTAAVLGLLQQGAKQ